MHLMHMTHRPVIRAEFNQTGEGVIPLADWGTWAEAREVLLGMGMAGHIYGIFVMHPTVTIEKETSYE